jgi:hypothetical protein
MVDNSFHRRPANTHIGHMHEPPGSGMEIAGHSAGYPILRMSGANGLHGQIAHGHETDRIGAIVSFALSCQYFGKVKAFRAASATLIPINSRSPSAMPPVIIILRFHFYIVLLT